MYGFEIGDRVRISDTGRRSLRDDGRNGTVVGFKFENNFGEELQCVKVQWDQNIYPTSLYYKYIEKGENHGWNIARNTK